jgi:hypothetical protein
MEISNNHIYNQLYSYLSKYELLDEFKQIFDVENDKFPIAKIWSNKEKFVNKYKWDEYGGVGCNVRENRAKIDGDIGELISLYWVGIYGSHPKIGFYHIQPTKRDTEGTDFIGFNKEGLNSILQTKTYKRTTILEAGKLETFFRSSPAHNVQFSKYPEENPSLFLFMPYGKISGEYRRKEFMKIIDYKLINKITHKGFWKSLFLTIQSEF